MSASDQIGDLALHHGQVQKRNNAVTAVLCGIVPAVLLAHYVSPAPEHWALGFLIGLLWANGFEYAYHRWLLHRPRSSFSREHLKHHANVGTPEEPEYVALGKSPFHVALLFLINGVPAIAIDAFFRFHLTPGVFLGWAAYLVLTEEIHWRIHMNGVLPSALRLARAYHLLHHDVPNRRYNICFPVFDFLFGTHGSALQAHPRGPLGRSAPQ